jgi:hypothetical protein
MKYILMMHAPKGTGDWAITDWDPKDFKAHMDFMHRLNKDLTQSGELVSCEGLAEPAQAKVVRVGKDGRPVTDGVFPEAKEFLAGYWIVDVDRTERAYEIAARASSAPGPGGAALRIPIEVRQVLTLPGDEGVAKG